MSAQRIDIAILCGHDYSNIRRWVVGSVADKVISRAEVPILLLHHAEVEDILADAHSDPSSSLRILVPLDGSADAETVLDPATQLIAALAFPLSGTLHIMNVINRSNRHEDSECLRIQEASDYLQQIIERMRKGDVAPAVAQYKMTTTWSIAVDTDITGAIIKTAENVGTFGGCDIIAIATHGLTGLSRWTTGSTTDRVHHHTQKPLLIVQLYPASIKQDEEIKTQSYEHRSHPSTI